MRPPMRRGLGAWSPTKTLKALGERGSVTRIRQTHLWSTPSNGRKRCCRFRAHRKSTEIRLFFIIFLQSINQLRPGPLEYHLRQREQTGITEAQGGREEIIQLRVRGAKGREEEGWMGDEQFTEAECGWSTSNKWKAGHSLSARPTPSILIACPPFLLIRFLHIFHFVPPPFASLSLPIGLSNLFSFPVYLLFLKTVLLRFSLIPSPCSLSFLFAIHSFTTLFFSLSISLARAAATPSGFQTTHSFCPTVTSRRPTSTSSALPLAANLSLLLPTTPVSSFPWVHVGPALSFNIRSI